MFFLLLLPLIFSHPSHRIWNIYFSGCEFLMFRRHIKQQETVEKRIEKDFSVTLYKKHSFTKKTFWNSILWRPKRFFSSSYHLQRYFLWCKANIIGYVTPCRLLAFRIKHFVASTWHERYEVGWRMSKARHWLWFICEKLHENHSWFCCVIFIYPCCYFISSHHT